MGFISKPGHQISNTGDNLQLKGISRWTRALRYRRFWLSQYPVLAVSQNAQSLRVARFTSPTQVSVKLIYVIWVRVYPDTDPPLYFYYQVTSAYIGPIRFKAHIIPSNQTGRHQQINKAMANIGFG